MIPVACARWSGAGRSSGAFLMPVLLAVFFVPALAALLWELVQLRHVSHVFTAKGRAFEPVQIEPLLSVERIESQETEK
jgi:hypothetical protein